MTGIDYGTYLQRHDQRGALLLVSGAFLGACAFMLVLWWTGYVNALRLLYPGLMTLVGLLLYLTDSARYLGFMWWMWFLAPFVRRVVDWQAGWVDPNPILLTPYLVAAISGLTLLNQARRLFNKSYFPFLLGLSGILYGYLIGMIRVSPVAATFDMLQWVAPLLVAFHIIATWEKYPEYREVVRQTFFWGLIVIGVYGLLQYFILFPWDAFWMITSDMASIGLPQPLLVRVFSMLNSPGPLSHVVLAGVLLLFYRVRLVNLLAAIPGYIVFLLSLVRSSWGAWGVALGFMILTSEGRRRTHLVAYLILGLSLGVPFIASNASLGGVSTRVASVTNLEQDSSFRSRLIFYRGVPLRIVTTPIGFGMGSTGTSQKLVTGQTRGFDSGLLNIPLVLGWLGGGFYFIALFQLLRMAYRSHGLPEDTFRTIARAIVLGMLALMLFATTHTGLSGTILWTFLALAVVSARYQKEEAIAYEEEANETGEEATW